MSNTIDLKCPKCNQPSLTFSRVVGPAEPAAKFNERLSRINAEAAKKAAGIELRTLENSKPNVDDAAVAWISETADRSAEEIYKDGQLEHLKKQHVAAKASLAENFRGVIGEVVVTYCTSCGHVLGTTLSPLKIDEGICGISKAIRSLTDAVLKSQRDLLEALGQMNQRLTAIEATTKKQAFLKNLDRIEDTIEDIFDEDD